MSCFVRDKTDAEGKLLKIKARLVAGGHLQGLVHYKVCSDALVCLLTYIYVASSVEMLFGYWDRLYVCTSGYAA